jgi:hypothetical protein
MGRLFFADQPGATGVAVELGGPMRVITALILAFAITGFAQQQPAPATSQAADPAQQPPSQSPGTARVAKPIVKTGEITENQQYKSDQEMFFVAVPAAGNPICEDLQVTGIATERQPS